VEPYRPQLLNRTVLENPQKTMSGAIDAGGKLVRRLLPFPSSGDSLPAMPLMSPSKIQESLLAGAVPLVAGQQAGTIVTEAAAILDEEMAKGVLAARGVNRTSDHGGSDSSNELLRQVHDLINRVAEMWPGPQGAAIPLLRPSESAPTGECDTLPVLTPGSPVRPGQRAAISMTLCNEESRSVCLVPAATDLLGSAGGRISANLLEFASPEIRLEPGSRKELKIAAAIPADTKPGCYSGILVVGGVDYLRALISIDVI
jgi:hypothetical protein